MPDFDFQWLSSSYAPLASAAVALFGFLGVYVQQRERALRRGEVFAWACRGIAAMQTINMIARMGPKGHEARLEALIFETTVLIEEGRLFFRNQGRLFHGGRQASHLGRRPRILDELVIGHKIARHMKAEPGAPRGAVRVVIAEATQRFVTYAQQEVGRTRAASRYGPMGGKPVVLPDLLAQVSGQSIAALEKKT